MRLFFALGCPAAIAARITAWRSSLAIDGSPVAIDDLHITLAFLGAQDSERLPQLIKLAEAIQTRGFRLELDRLQLWSGGLLRLAPSQPPEALLDLARHLRSDLLELGIASEPREYQPHLTLARHCQQPLPGIAPTFAWQVSGFSLFVSESGPAGVRYRALASWPLLGS